MLYSDSRALIEFIDNITSRRVSGSNMSGYSNMVDFCKISDKFYFHPLTKGGSSLKLVLPSLMKSSSKLREIYNRAWYGSTVSLNFKDPCNCVKNMPGK